MTRVLLLEDNVDMLSMLTQVLEWGGYEVIGGRTGREGVALLEENAHRLPDIIISDLHMPDMGGLAFLDYVRGHEQWSEMPFVIMSAHSASQDRRQVEEHGANDFLIKPFNLDDFQAVLAKWHG